MDRWEGHFDALRFAGRDREIKSVRDGHVSIGEGFCRVQEHPPALMMYQVHIGEYAPAAALGHVPARARVLLANKKEIVRFARAMSKGKTIVPLKLYFQGKWAKVLIGIGMGRKAHDKRAAIKQRESDREMLRLNSRRV